MINLIINFISSNISNPISASALAPAMTRTRATSTTWPPRPAMGSRGGERMTEVSVLETGFGTVMGRRILFFYRNPSYWVSGFIYFVLAK